MIYASDRKNDRLDARMLARLGRADVELLAPVDQQRAGGSSPSAPTNVFSALQICELGHLLLAQTR